MTEDNVTRERDRKIAYVRLFRKAAGWSIRAYAAAAGVSQGGYIRKMDKPDFDPTNDLLTKLYDAIHAEVKLKGLK